MHIYRLILIHLSLSNGAIWHTVINNELADRYFHVGYLSWVIWVICLCSALCTLKPKKPKNLKKIPKKPRFFPALQFGINHWVIIQEVPHLWNYIWKLPVWPSPRATRRDMVMRNYNNNLQSMRLFERSPADLFAYLMFTLCMWSCLQFASFKFLTIMMWCSTYWPYVLRITEVLLVACYNI